MGLKVYKFGGASVATPSLVSNLQNIISDVDDSLVVVISAIGKTTNALEQIVYSIFDGNKDEAHNQFKAVEKIHTDYISSLFSAGAADSLLAQLNGFYTEIEWMIESDVHPSFDYLYDQVVSVGELLSTAIIAFYLKSQGLNVQWMDVRDVLRTDDSYRDAKVDHEWSKSEVNKTFGPILQAGTVIITQGFIGSTDQNSSTTLGREGSDYTASLLGSFLGAESVSIWKDVKGLMTADPRIDSEAELIDEIPYSEVIEMAYYGAQVIHPKTIKPLYNSRIPMYVKCFLDKSLPGTKIGTDRIDLIFPPLKVVKENQLIVKFTTRDFSFFNEKNLSLVYRVFHKLNIKQNLTHVSAISLDVVIDNKREVEKNILEALETHFKIEFQTNKTLYTIRHYMQKHLDTFYALPQFDLVERTPRTLQYVM